MEDRTTSSVNRSRVPASAIAEALILLSFVAVQLGSPHVVAAGSPESPQLRPDLNPEAPRSPQIVDIGSGGAGCVALMLENVPPGRAQLQMVYFTPAPPVVVNRPDFKPQIPLPKPGPPVR